MKLGRVSILVLILCLALLLIVATLSFVSFPTRNENYFSELWLLGSEHTADNFPFNVSVNEQYPIYVGVGNHLTNSADYSVRVKFGTTPYQYSDSSTSTPSSSPTVHEISFGLSEGEVWETSMILAFDYTFPQENVSRVRSISINDMTFPVSYTSSWDSNRSGFYYFLSFELWLANKNSNAYEYQNLYTGLCLNMTGP